MIRFLRTNSENKDFVHLVESLNDYLKKVDGNTHDFYNQYNGLDDLKHVIMASVNNIPAGCGAFKAYDKNSVEIKRMYTNPDFRGQGIASKILLELEKWAKERVELVSNQSKETPSKEEPKSEPVKDSSGGRAGKPEVNKAVRAKADSFGITPEKLGKEEYQTKMAQAAIEALTDSNFHSEARELVAKLEGKPELAEKPDYPDVRDPKFNEKMSVIKAKYASKYTDDVDNDARELGTTASQEAGWSGDDAVDSIAYTLRMKGFHKLADTIQSVIKENKSTSLNSLLPESLIINEGTRSQVGVIKGGKIISVYVHYDGYPSNMKDGLKKHMKDEKDVMTLIKKGGARGIYDDKDIEYYGNMKPMKGDVKNIDDYVRNAGNEASADYVYLYNTADKKWYYAKTYDDTKLKKLF